MTERRMSEMTKRQSPARPRGSGVGDGMVGSDLSHAAVDEEFDAGDVGGVVGGEEEGGPGDLVGVTDAAERDLRGHAGLELPGGFGVAGEAGDGRGVDGAGG